MSYSFPLAFGVVLSTALVVSGAGAPIGTVKASGDFRLAGASVRGNGTLFSGDMVESDNLRANVTINGGKELTLAPHSRGKIFEERVVLESGASELRSSSPYAIEAGRLRVSTPSGRATVEYSRDSGEVMVAANEGQVDVRNARGILIARLRNGQTVAFQTQNNNSLNSVSYAGVIRKTAKGEYLLTDAATGVTVELRGLTPKMERSVGQMTTIHGTTIADATPASGSSVAILVTSTGDRTVPAGTTSSSAKPGVRRGAIAAVAGGGALAAVFGGLAASDAFGSDTSR